MSLLIGYHLGTHGHWIRHFSSRILRLLGFGGGGDHDKGNNLLKASRDLVNYRRNGQQYSNQNGSSRYSNGGQMHESMDSTEMYMEDEMETRMSDITSDSAIDLHSGSALSEDDIDEQILELLNYNNLYSDLYTKNAEPRMLGQKGDDDDDTISRKRFRNGTVDRIDQVLQQVDDIKKSIVEIDDELYQIAGSTYANFNPDFLTLTNHMVEEFDDDDLFELTPSQKVSENRPSLTKVHLEEASRKLAASTHFPKHSPKEKLTTASDGSKSDSQSHASLSDLDSLPLEWDFDFESGYDYDSTAQSELKSNKPSQLKEKLSSVANGLEMPMTDEQKLKNMHDLLDEAKKMGLLNNIIDALAPETARQHTNQSIKKKEAPWVAHGALIRITSLTRLIGSLW